MRAVWPSLIMALFLPIAAAPAAAETKRAFVVGIDRYDNLPEQAQLKKAVGDARAMGETFAQLGYTVTADTNTTRPRFNDRWQSFLQSIRPGDSVAFVFSGHGIEINGANYLLPRDVPRIRLGRDEQLKRESLSLSEILADLRERKPRFSLIILDAFRDNPFEEGTRTVGGARGLARVEPPQGTFIMFSAGAYQTALDRLSDADREPTSIYTRTLVPLLRTQGLSLLDLADRVGEQVRDLAATVPHQQTPAFYSGVIGGRRVCLAGCEVGAAVPAQLATPAPSGAAEVVRVFREVETMTSLSMLVVLERQHVGTPAADCISARMGEVKAAQAAAVEELRQRYAAQQAAAAKAEEEERLRAAALIAEETRRATEDTRKQAEAKKTMDVAAYTPPATSAPAMEAASTEVSTRSIQQELKRVGCDPGSIDGRWGPKVRSAIADFSKRTSVELAADEPTPTALAALRAQEGRVCPPQCITGEVEKNGNCVAVPRQRKAADAPSRGSETVSKPALPSTGPPSRNENLPACANWNTQACRDRKGRECSSIGGVWYCR
jgi:hypothetical protein